MNSSQRATGHTVAISQLRAQMGLFGWLGLEGEVTCLNLYGTEVSPTYPREISQESKQHPSGRRDRVVWFDILLYWESAIYVTYSVITVYVALCVTSCYKTI